jgi:hypothetical protein
MPFLPLWPPLRFYGGGLERFGEGLKARLQDISHGENLLGSVSGQKVHFKVGSASNYFG